MAKPRRVVPGATHMLTRRTYQRTFRLRPSELTNQIALYCLGWAAAKYGMLIHAFVLMSNHHHLELTDPNGLLPDFLRDFHRSMAKALNASQGQWENLWSAEHASAVLLPTLDDLLGSIAYTVANPVAAGLVEDPSQWPGVMLWEPGASIVMKRPTAYFDPNGSAPESVELRIVPPPNTEAQSWGERVRRAVADEVARARGSVLSQGMRFLGAAAVKAKSFLQRAKSNEVKRAINPVLAARDVFVRKTFQRILRQFRRSYAAALALWRAGDRGVEFPFGTWWMRVHHEASVSPAPTG
jgi:putative transposase